MVQVYLYQWRCSSSFKSFTLVLTKNTYCNLCLVVLAGRAVEGLTLRNSFESSFDFLSSFEAEITGLTETSLVSTGVDGDDLQILQRVYTFNSRRTVRLTETRRLAIKYMAGNLRFQFNIEVTVSSSIYIGLIFRFLKYIQNSTIPRLACTFVRKSVDGLVND